MTLQEIRLSATDSEKLSTLLKIRNEGLPYQQQLTYQQLAEEILLDGIWQRYRDRPK